MKSSHMMLSKQILFSYFMIEKMSRLTSDLLPKPTLARPQELSSFTINVSQLSMFITEPTLKELFSSKFQANRDP